VELALAHANAGNVADEQRAFASYREARNQYIPQFIIGSGLGKSWGFPLSLEGSAPSILNVNSQSALFNPALREFIKAAQVEYKAASFQSKDQRDQVIQDATLSYVELNKWESMLGHLQEEQAQAAKMEDIVAQRIREGIDSPAMQAQAKLGSARVRLRIAEAQGSVDVLRNRLAQMTGLPAESIQTTAESVPALPEVKQEDNLVGKAVESSPSLLAAQNRATALDFRARGQHRSLWPAVDFAAQYAILARYNNYDEFFATFQRHNATVGVSIRFPFFNASQHAHAEAADAEAIKGHHDAELAKNKVSEETLRLQRTVQQMAAAQEVASLEYQVSQGNVDALQVKVDAGTANLHDLDDVRNQTNERYQALQDSNFQLQRARIALLRATGELANWVGVSAK
jgi:outer membrane protein TolC